MDGHSRHTWIECGAVAGALMETWYWGDVFANKQPSQNQESVCVCVVAVIIPKSSPKAVDSAQQIEIFTPDPDC